MIYFDNAPSSVAFTTCDVLAYLLHESARTRSRLPRAKRKHITYTRLVEVFRKINGQSVVSRPPGGTVYDFERSLKYVREQGLEDHIKYVSLWRRDQALPLNSERHIYELYNIVVRDLEIELDNSLAWAAVGDWFPVSSAKWHFEGCRFLGPSPGMWSFVFPWRGSFRFHKSDFCHPDQYGGLWTFAFGGGSRAWFVGNDFTSGRIQVSRARPSAEMDDPGAASVVDWWLGRIAFVANDGVQELDILEGYSSIEITGTNRIDRLTVDLNLEADRVRQTSIYLGPREKIDPLFHNCMQHRSLFLDMRQLAAMNHDSRQLTVLDRQLERIEYFLNKGQNTPSPLDCRVWIEYWQDRVLYAWRRWSSDFYRSWLRPLVMLVAGYLVINALPYLLVEPFSASHWIDLTVRPVTEIATFEISLGRIVGNEYETVPALAKTFLKLMGLVEVVWIGVWGFALAKSIRR